MEENKGNGGNTILLTVIGIATLLVAIVGATFAYFTATISDGDKGSSIIIQTAQLAITYHDGDNLVASGITPGWSSTKTVTITNTTNYSADFSFGWKPGLYNTISNDELVYTMTCTVQAEPDYAGTPTLGTLPAYTNFVDRVIAVYDPANASRIGLIDNATIAAHNQISCIFLFEFLEMNVSQNYNQQKTFYGTLELVANRMSAEQ